MYAERAVKLLKQMRENCVPKETDTYNDPLRKEKHDALSMAIAQLSGHTGTHARWEKTWDLIDGHDGYKCSACGATKYFDHYAEDIRLCTPFCGYCGAKMDKEKTGD